MFKNLSGHTPDRLLYTDDYRGRYLKRQAEEILETKDMFLAWSHIATAGSARGAATVFILGITLLLLPCYLAAACDAAITRIRVLFASCFLAT